MWLFFYDLDYRGLIPKDPMSYHLLNGRFEANFQPMGEEEKQSFCIKTSGGKVSKI